MKPRPESTPPYILLLGAVSALFAACAEPPSSVIDPAPAAAVQTVFPEKGDVRRWLTRPAQVRAIRQVVLYAKITGYLQSLAVDEGDVVKAGQVVAEIEVPELVAEAAKCRAELDAARIEYERLEKGRKRSSDLVTPQSVDAAEARFHIAQAILRRHEVSVGFTRILAPFDGVVTKRWVDPGAFIAAATASSNPQTSALLTVMDFSRVRVEIAIPEPEVPFVKTGALVSLVGDSLPDGGLEGAVTRFAYALDEATRSMSAQVELPNLHGSLRPGMFVEARIAVEEHRGAWLVPTETVVTEKLKTSVFLVVDGKAKKVAVRAGFNDGRKVEILDGIGPADAVILAGKLQLREGQSVAPQPGTGP